MRAIARRVLRISLSTLVLIAFPSIIIADTGSTSLEGRQQFQEIASHLDLGGELMLVVNTDSLVDSILETAASTDVGTPADAPEEQEIRDGIARLHAYLNRNGFSAVHGAGVSVMLREDGLHALKIFIGRDYIDSNLPLWRGLVGWHPRRLLSLDFLPAETALTRAGTPELGSLWKVINAAVDDVASQHTQERFSAWNATMDTVLGIEIEEIIANLRDEVLVAITLSEQEESVIPTKGGLVTIPSPELLVVIGTSSDVMRGVLEAQFAKHKITLIESQVGDVRIRTAKNRLPSLIPMQPSYATQDEFLILGSTPAIVEKALLTYRHKNGLLARPEFKKAFQGLSMVNNGIIYMSPEMGAVLGVLREPSIESALKSVSKYPTATRLLRHLLTYGGDNQSCALVIQNWKKGVMVMGSSARGAKSIMTRMAAHPARIMSMLLDESPKHPRYSLKPWFNHTTASPAPTHAEDTSDGEPKLTLQDLPGAENRVNLQSR